MGKRKRVKKNLKENKNQEEASSSSSLMRNEAEESTKDPNPSGAQTVVKVETSINDFPPEILTKILKFVDAPSLFGCRLVNVKWSEISSGILWTRPKTDLWFSFHGTRFFSKCQKTESKALRSLRDFLDCMKNTKLSPFARFDIQVFSRPPEGVFEHKDWLEFLSDFAHFPPKKQNENETENQVQNQRTKIKFLGMRFHNFDTQKSFVVLIEKLRNLLLNQIPNLEELRLIFPSSTTGTKEISLFPSPEEGVSVPAPAQLAKLKVIYFEKSMFQNFPQISRDLLNSAVNLKKIHVENFDEATFNQIKFLISLRKPFLIQKYSIKLTQELFLLIKQQQNPWMLQFEELELKIDVSIFGKKSNSSAHDYGANFVSQLFASTKNTLRKLKMESVGFLAGVQFPRFKNLAELELLQPQIQNDSLLQIFPGGVRSLDIFPVVSFLDFEFYNWAGGFPQEDSIPVLPNVKSLRVADWKLGQTGISISILALMCPNLKHFEIFRAGGGIPFLEIGRAIWTHMKQLESLEVAVDMRATGNYSTALDSCLTGISMEDCQRLADLKEADRLLEKWGSPTRVLESELTAAAERKHPSILDMKELKKCSINLFSGWQPLTKSECMTNFSWISREHAFKLMPHLFQMEQK